MRGKHVIICGERNSGKTEIIDRLVKQCSVPVYGFCTRIMRERSDGYHEIYMYPAGVIDGHMNSENHLADCNTKDRTVNDDVFKTLGMEYLKAGTDGIIVMDEIGFMEESVSEFCKAILEHLDGNIPVLAAVKGGKKCNLTEKVLNHPRTRVFYLDGSNQDMIYDKILPYVIEWNNNLKKENINV